MAGEDQYREHALQIVATSTPLGFWRDYQDRARALYLDAYKSVAADPQLNPTQRQSKLWQERHFRMEWLLVDVAKKNAVPAHEDLIRENRCAYALAGRGGVQMTQKYVREPGTMPSPAKFRRQLAAMRGFYREPGLLFGDEPIALAMPKELTGIILHSPIGPRFLQQHQGLGTLGFYIPYKDFKSWAVELSFAEIIGTYDLAVQEDRVKPVLRPLEIQKIGRDE